MTRTIDPTSRFLFTVCQVGAEDALKRELEREHPELRFAYSRPGFVTFKFLDEQNGLGLDFVLKSVFARAYGLSLQKTKPQADEILKIARSYAADFGPLRLHLWERDQYVTGEEPPTYLPQKIADPLLEVVFAEGRKAGVFHSEKVAAKGDLVFDVVLVEPQKTPGEAWIGLHRHHYGHSAWPGGNPRLTLPPEAPSRSWLKIEEAVLWSGAQLRRGDVAVEIGSAPGGAAYALLQRGIHVVGIDPAEMDPKLLTTPTARYEHIKKSVGSVLREELPGQIQWLLLDMNVEPKVALGSIDRLATRMVDSLLGMFLTVKLNRWDLAEEIPSMVAHFKAMGMARVRATQLPGHRQEFLLYGVTRRGLSREPRS